MTMSPRVLLLARSLLLALIFSAPCAVRADVAVLVPPRAEGGLRSELVEQAVEELSRLLRLQGFDVISAGQAGATAEAEQATGGFPRGMDPLACANPDCADEYRRLFDAPFAVQLALASGPQSSEVSITLTETESVFFTGTATVEANDVRAAVRAAFEAAREKQKDGVGPWLTVDGAPQGAEVFVDGASYGKLPVAKRRIEPGVHELEVRAADHARERRELDVPVRFDHVETVEVQLAPLDDRVAGGARRGRIRRSPWDWALGGALAAVGVVHLAAGIYQKSVDGDCVESSQLGCTEHYGDRRGASRENLLIGFGAAALSAGALVLGLAPIGRLQVRSGVDRVALELKGAF